LNEEVKKDVLPLVAQLVGLCCDPPISPKKEGDKYIPLTAKDFEPLDKIVELETLQSEVYNKWGVKLELEGRKDLKPLQVFEELAEAVPQGLSEQRERVLDLIDRVLSAMVEESCPENKPAEDWDWKGIAAAFKEHFQQELPAEARELGDPSMLVRELYARAEEIYLAREKEVGVELFMRIFRFVFTKQIDDAWVEHLSNMEHLRDGIGLRGYGQRDPKNEYKKEGYNLFLNMMAKVSSTVLVQLFEVQIQRQEDIAALEAQEHARHQAELEQAVARHPGEEADDPVAALAQMQRIAAGQGPTPSSPPPARAAPRIGRNDPCPCGSGLKFKKCHGAILEEEGATDDEAEEEQPRA
jgi:preprotein translocase subunit SecA